METTNVGQLRVLHTADLHLDRSFASWGDAGAIRRQDLLDTLEDIGNLARQYQVHLVVMAGDQFDKHNPDPAVISRFRLWLDRLGQYGTKVAIISGNHDSYWYENSVYRKRLTTNVILFQEPHCHEPVEISLGGMSVWLYGIAHDHTQHRDILPGFQRRSEEDIHIGLLHATVDPRPDFDVAVRYLPLTSTELASTELDYIALGHIHRARTINAGQRGMAAYPGSPEPLDSAETGPRSVNLITFSGGLPEIQTIPVGRRFARKETIDTTSLTSEEIAQRITSLADHRLILSAELTGAPREIPNIQALQNELARHFCYLTVSDNTSIVESGYVRSIENERTIRGAFVRRLQERIETATSERERETAELALQLGLIQLERRSAE